MQRNSGDGQQAEERDQDHGQSQGSGFLAFTGGNIAMLVVIGLGAAGAGIVLVRYGRRRRAGVTAS